ncbi:hypothetical protein AACH10_20525 [Ideonella sp. DXS22W]|uniref:Uncharacterized protein n=1 Tax=Pseudaquabacterium inlustre TaxID=2984192 RepID=A0ABU9CLF5_9BURK
MLTDTLPFLPATVAPDAPAWAPHGANGLVQSLMGVAEAAALVRSGRPCCIAGDAQALRSLPPGRWIGGSIPYFMAEQGGLCSREQVFVTELPQLPPGAGDGAWVQRYTRETLSRVCTDAPAHGFSLIVLPAFSAVHEAFAQEAPDYPEMYQRPLLGWVAGLHLDDLGQALPGVMHGPDGRWLHDEAVVLHVPVSPALQAHLDIVNPFEPSSGPGIVFDAGGFSAGDCLIDGQPANLHDWLLAGGADTRLPLVADYCGAMVNVSIKALDAAAHRVDFYAPVFPGVVYRCARPLPDYVAAFERALARQQPPGTLVMSCNCILNYLHGGLEGRTLGAMRGPATFGEIAYQLLNQTLVYLTLVEA